MMRLAEICTNMRGRVSRLVRVCARRICTKKGAVWFAGALGLLAIPSIAHAGAKETVIVLIGNVTQFFVELLGKLLIAVIDILVKVAQYNDFGDSQAVNIGWVVSRDLANMLFIVALIVIAFGTIVGWEQYKYNRLLGKLALTAVIINFSKAITLFLIDFSQVVMLTFVNAFRDVAAGNLTTAFGIRALLTYAESSTSVDIDLTQTVMIYALAIILIIIALLVTLTLVVVLARRIISLWVLIILSPLAFIASVMPGGVGSFNGQWWSKLGKEMFTGPVLAFFLWLTFSIIFLTSGQGVESTATIIDIDASGSAVISSASTEEEVQAVASEVGSSRNIFNFIAAIVLLIHSLSIAKEAGGFAGQFAGAVSNKINAAGTRAINGSFNFGKKAAFGTAAFATSGVRGVAARAGYAAADAGLKPFQAIPLVGGKIRKARAKINERRDYIEPESMRYIKSLSNSELSKIGDGKALTRSAVVERRHAVEELMRRDKGHLITDRGMKNYRSAIGYTAKIERDDQGNILGVAEDARYRDGFEKISGARMQNPNLYRMIFPGAKAGSDEEKAIEAEFRSDMRKAKKGDFLNLTPEALQNPDIARMVNEEYQTRLASSESFGKDMKRDATDQLRWVVEHDGAPFPTSATERIKDKFAREQEARKRLNLGDSADNLDLMIEYANKMQKNEITGSEEKYVDVANKVDSAKGSQSYEEVAKSLQAYKGSKTRMSDKNYAEAKKQFEGAGAKSEDSPRAQALVDVTDAEQKQFEREQTRRKRLGLGADSSHVDDMLSYARAQKSGLVISPGAKASAGATAVQSRLAQGEKIDEIIKSLEDFKADKNRMSDDEYEQARQSVEQYLAYQSRGGESPELVGAEHLADRVQSDVARAQKEGKASYARLAADFSKLGLVGAGAYASGEQKDALAANLSAMYRQELIREVASARSRINQSVTSEDRERIEQQVQEFSGAIQKADKLALVNTKRKGYTLPHVLRHENAHAEIEKIESTNPEALESIFGTLPQEEQNRIVQEFSDRVGIGALPEEERKKIAMTEYFTEGLANYGRTQDAVGEQFGDGVALALKSAGVKLRGYQQKALPTTGFDRSALDSAMRQAEMALQGQSKKLDQEFASFVERHNLQGEKLLEDKEMSIENFEDSLIQKELEEQWQIPKKDIDALVNLQREKRRLKGNLQQLKKSSRQSATKAPNSPKQPEPQKMTPSKPESVPSEPKQAENASASTTARPNSETEGPEIPKE